MATRTSTRSRAAAPASRAKAASRQAAKPAAKQAVKTTPARPSSKAAVEEEAAPKPPSPYRRDAVGFGLFALAIVVAASEWWGIPGPFGTGVHAVIAGALGRVGVAVPVVLVMLGVGLLRRRKQVGDDGRRVIGTLLLAAATCALVAMGMGRPVFADGFAALQNAGGLLGYVLANPLAAAATAPVAVALFVLLAAFSLLIITATPVHRIPERLRYLSERLTGQVGDHADAETDGDDGGAASRRGMHGDEAYEQAAIVDHSPEARRPAKPRGTRRLRAAQAAETAGADPAGVGEVAPTQMMTADEADKTVVMGGGQAGAGRAASLAAGLTGGLGAAGAATTLDGLTPPPPPPAPANK
ncbi:MAG: DNA translocase FtsK 4TM domain-containing protein, partial [Cellulomonadaceae bacterium]|nr:DNA translocase FtsK 4TM domain-containing protein [Cellulomonadaceae bacterium]